MSRTGPSMLKRLRRYQAAKERFPERAEFYDQQIEELEAGLKDIKACMRCGRPLKGEESQARGYGPECARKESAHLLKEGEEPTYE